MFDKLRQLNQMRELQAKLGNERFEVEKNGVKIAMNGKMEIQDLVLNPQLPIEEQTALVKEVFHDAMKKAHMLAAQHMSQLL